MGRLGQASPAHMGHGVKAGQPGLKVHFKGQAGLPTLGTSKGGLGQARDQKDVNCDKFCNLVNHK